MSRRKVLRLFPCVVAQFSLTDAGQQDFRSIFAGDKVHRIDREIVIPVAPEYVSDVESRAGIAADLDQY